MTKGIFLLFVAAAAALITNPGDPNRREIFSEVTDESGINWAHFNGESQDRFLIESTCGGVGFVDYDDDGNLDIYFVAGGETPRGKDDKPVRSALYRNLGNGRFRDAAAEANVDHLPFFGMGVAAADYDNDGHQDLFVTGYPRSALYHNNGNGVYTDVTAKAGVENPGKWSASAAWIDYDRDGYLDLFVCNYVKFSYSDIRRCEYAGRRGYCEQKEYQGDISKLYHNNGDGTFTDVTQQSGVGKYAGRSLGVISIDADDDEWTDLFVAEDATPNLLLINRRDGTFEDKALEAEVAFSPNGIARSGMGVDAGDVDGDGRPDFVVTNFNDEYHALYSSMGLFPYEERTRTSGLAGETSPYVGWGCRFLDYDNDGDLDLVITNGHINEEIEFTRQDVTYMQPPLLLSNNGRGVFRNMRASAGLAFRTKYSGRGMAAGDFDNDGDLDVVFVCLKDKPVLLRNNVGQENSWIGFRLVGTKSNRDAVGARITLTLGEGKLVRWMTSGSSFLASHDRRIVFGLGEDSVPEALSVVIRWPNGSTQTVSGLKPNRYHRILEP